VLFVFVILPPSLREAHLTKAGDHFQLVPKFVRSWMPLISLFQIIIGRFCGRSRRCFRASPLCRPSRLSVCFSHRGIDLVWEYISFSSPDILLVFCRPLFHKGSYSYTILFSVETKFTRMFAKCSPFSSAFRVISFRVRFQILFFSPSPSSKFSPHC